VTAATAASREATQAAKAMGHADEDMAAIVKWLEKMADVTVE